MSRSINYYAEIDSSNKTFQAIYICLNSIFFIVFAISFTLYLLGLMDSIFISKKVILLSYQKALKAFKVIKLSEFSTFPFFS